MNMDQETIRKARQTDLVTFLQSQGFTLKKEGKNYRVGEHGGILVKDNMFTDFVNSDSGNAVDFCQRVLKMNFKEAIQQLVAHDFTSGQTYDPRSRQEPKECTLPERAENQKRVIAYLQQTRGIPIPLIQELLKEKLLYQDKKGNAVFVCRDNEGTGRGAILRGTLTEKSFKQRIGSGEFPFLWLPSTEKQVITITEAPIDMVSLVALYPESRRTIHAALGGIEFEEAVEKLLQTYPNTKRLVFAFDNDEAGKKAVERFTKRFGSHVDTRAFLPSHVDWNEQWMGKIRENVRQQKQLLER